MRREVVKVVAAFVQAQNRVDLRQLLVAQPKLSAARAVALKLAVLVTWQSKAAHSSFGMPSSRFRPSGAAAASLVLAWGRELGTPLTLT